MATLSTNIQYLKGVWGKRARLYAPGSRIATIGTCGALPAGLYEIFPHPSSTTSAPYDEPCAIRARVAAESAEQRIRKGLSLRSRY